MIESVSIICLTTYQLLVGYNMPKDDFRPNVFTIQIVYRTGLVVFYGIWESIIYIYIYIYVRVFVCFGLVGFYGFWESIINIYIYIYIYICVCVCVCMCVCVGLVGIYGISTIVGHLMPNPI